MKSLPVFVCHVCFTVVAILSSKSALALQVDSQDAIADPIERILAEEAKEQNLVGLAVGVIQPGQDIRIATHGYSNLEREQPVTSDTVFNWASNSKPVVAAMLLRHVERGRVELDQDVRTLVPSLEEKAHVVTLRHVLCHVSGIPHYRNGRVLPGREVPDEWRDELDPIVGVSYFRASPLLFQPGERYSYSSYAYILLSAAVQAASDTPLTDQVDEFVNRDLGLASFQLDTPDRQPEWTFAYRKSFGGKLVRVRDAAHFWKHGAGGYKSNVEDFAKWARALMEGEMLNDDTRRQMFTRQPLLDGSPGRFGLGVVVSGEGRTLRVEHGGSQEETRTSMVLYPRQSLGVVVMCNTQHAETSRIAEAILEVIMENQVRESDSR